MADRDAVPALAAPLLKKFVSGIHTIDNNNRKPLYWTGTIWNVPKYTDVDASTAPTGNGQLITDMGIQYEGDPPSIVVMSVWEEAHQQKLKEMRLWLSHGPQTQVVIIFVWRIIPTPPGEESNFSLTPEVYDYTESEPNKYKQRTSPTLKPLFGICDIEYYRGVDIMIWIGWNQLRSTSTSLAYDPKDTQERLLFFKLIEPAKALLKKIEENRTILQNHIKTEKPSLSYFYPNYMTPNVGLQAESEQAAKFSQYLQTIMPPNTDKSITDAAGILTLYDLVVLISDPKPTNLTHFERPLQALENIYTIVHGQAGDGIWKLCWLHHTEEIKDVHTAGEITAFLKNHPRAPGKPPPPPTPGENEIPLGRELRKKIFGTHITATPWPPAGHNYKRPLIVLVFATGNTSGEGPPNSSAALREAMSEALKAVTPTRGSAAVIFVFARIGSGSTIQALFKQLNDDPRFISATNTAQRPTETNLATQATRFETATTDNRAVVMLVQLLLKPLTTKWDSVVP